jgi:phospholipid/cholesterol/gamma-HCH transport system ATP-binding protein
MSPTATAEVVIVLDGVSKAFGSKHVLREASLEISRGETVVILGASGSGKSVTLKTVNGLLEPDAGTVEVLAQRVDSRPEAELAPLRQRVSYLFQGGALFDSMSVFDNIAFPIREHLDLDRDTLDLRVGELLGMVQLEGVDLLDPSELSGGMRKRVALARALALDPEIILYDEPTTGLDPVTGEAIADLILDLGRRPDVTSVVVTHDIPLTRRIADRVVFLDDGRFVYSGPVEQAATIGPDMVRRFFAAGGTDA